MKCPNCGKLNIKKLYTCGEPGKEKTFCDDCKGDRNKSVKEEKNQKENF
jgi:hypothetical protein